MLIRNAPVASIRRLNTRSKTTLTTTATQNARRTARARFVLASVLDSARRRLSGPFEQMALFDASVANLKAARTFELDDDFAVSNAQFDLATVAASSIDLLRDQRRALHTSARFAARNVAASVDAKCLRFGIEIGLQHS